MKKVLLVVPYPKNEAPSQRFRFEQFMSKCDEFEFHHKPFLDHKTWAILYKEGHTFAKAFGILNGFIRRFFLLFSLHRYSTIFIHREAAPLGPPVWEFLAAKIFRKSFIYDFDDAIWLPNTSEQNKIAALLKAHWKVKHICKWAEKVSCGNQYLQNYAAQYNSNTVFLPTTIDLTYHHLSSLKNKNEKPIIGWTGSHSTTGYLKILIPVLEKIAQEFEYTFLLISNQDCGFSIPNKEFQPWSKHNEIEQLSRIDIGVMPLEDTKWEHGKCGFKALQYMALGIPCIASAVGANKEIIQSEKNGFLCQIENEWTEKISFLLENEQERTNLGLKGKQTIEAKYSLSANYNTYKKLFS